MADNKPSTTAQLRKDLAPAASPLGTDDEAADNATSADRVEMAREAEQKIGKSAKRADGDAVEAAQEQRDSNAPYGKEDHMNYELAKQKASESN